MARPTPYTVQILHDQLYTVAYELYVNGVWYESTPVDPLGVRFLFDPGPGRASFTLVVRAIGVPNLADGIAGAYSDSAPVFLAITPGSSKPKTFTPAPEETPMDVRQSGVQLTRPNISVVAGEVDPLPPTIPPLPDSRLSTFTLAPNPTIGGTAVVATLTLTAAGTADLVIALAADAGASVPPAVTIPAGDASITFPVTTLGVATETSVVLAAFDGTIRLKATLTLTPDEIVDPPPPPPDPDPVLAGLTLSPATPVGGTTISATLTLDIVAPAGGWEVTLAATGGIIAPSSVLVPAGQLSYSFSLATAVVTEATTATLTASRDGVSKVASIVLQPEPVTPPPDPTLQALTLTPTEVEGGTPVDGLVTLSGAAPAGGLTVALTSSSPSASVPAAVTVPGGASSVSFTITTTAPASTATAIITATLNGVTREATLTIQPAVVEPPPPPPDPATLDSLSVSPATLTGGSPAQGTVTLAAAVGVDTVVALSSSHPSIASVPSSVTVLAGTLSRTFPVTTTEPATATSVTLTATLNGGTRTALLTVNKPAEPPPPPPPPTGEAHDYFEALSLRSDLIAAYALRTDPQITAYKFGSYVDTVGYDPTVDACAFRWTAGGPLNQRQLRLPLGTVLGEKALIIWDSLFDSGFLTARYRKTDGSTSRINGFKTYQVSRDDGGSDRIWCEPQLRFIAYDHGEVGLWSVRGYNTVYPPTTKGGSGADPGDYNYGGDALGPMLGEFLTKADIWTRFYLEIDETQVSPDGSRMARISFWIGDETRDPVQILSQAQMWSGSASHRLFWIEWNTSTTGTMVAPMTSYSRNVVMLRNLADPTSVFQRPVR